MFSTKCTNCMCDHILTIVTWFSTTMIAKCVFCYPKTLNLAVALAVTGAWKGINKSKLYDELGWKYLSERRRRRLTHFHKLIHLATPEYMIAPVSQSTPCNYSLCSRNAIEPLSARTQGYYHSYYPYSIREWNRLDPSLRSTE